MIYTRIVFLIAKLAQLAIQQLGRGGGTALPGLLAERLHSQLLRYLMSQLEGTIVVVGTNGKTTTSRLLSSYLEGSDLRLVHNRSGSNLVRGILSALIAQSDWHGRIDRSWGLFEVDEAVLPKLLKFCSPDYIVVLNLFRDQLDRYGEVDAIAASWRKACKNLPYGTKLILNADDPLVAYLGAQTSATSIYFGLDYLSDTGQVASYADTRFCPRCGRPLRFIRVHYSHLGVYVCSTGDYQRPNPTVYATDIALKGMDGSQFSVVTGNGKMELDLGLAGLYNIYNAVAAITVADQVALSTDTVIAKTRHFEAVFGRLEKIVVNGIELILILVKNPTGYNQVIQTMASDSRADSFWLVLNDKFADGRDISWIWDVEFEKMARQSKQVLVSGTRAYDMAVRVKYAGFSQDQVALIPSLSEGLRTVVKSQPKSVYCLCTYTAMLELRRLLQAKKVVTSYHGS